MADEPKTQKDLSFSSDDFVAMKAWLKEKFTGTRASMAFLAAFQGYVMAETICSHPDNPDRKAGLQLATDQFKNIVQAYGQSYTQLVKARNGQK